jgi:hypothetical protein
MSTADRYRKLAAEFRAKARYEMSARLQSEWASLSEGYLRLAEQAERNDRNDVSYEPRWSANLGGEPA